MVQGSTCTPENNMADSSSITPVAADRFTPLSRGPLTAACRMMQPEDEVFEDLDFDLLGGVDLPQAPVGADGANQSRDQTSSGQHKQATSGDTTQAAPTPSAGTAAGAAGAPVGVGGVPYEFDDQMFVMEDHTQEPQFAADGHQQEPAESDHQQERDQTEAGGSARCSC